MSAYVFVLPPFVLMLTCFLLAAIWHARWRKSHNNYDDDPLQITLNTIGGISVFCFLLFGLLGVTTFEDSRAKVGELQSIRDSIFAYQDAITQTDAVVIAGRASLDRALTDTAYQGAATSYSQRVAEYRDLIKKYNEGVRNLQRRNQGFWDTFYADLPADMQPITAPIAR